MARAVVVGLDGVTWKTLLPWVEHGELPNIKKLMDCGSWGTLRSVVPPLTCPAWKCYSTGKNPGKFGVFARTTLDFEKGRIDVADSSCYKSNEIWDCLEKAGMSSAVIDMPTTYPPRKINGFMIASIEPPNCDNYTYPPELQKRLETEFGYKPDIEGTLFVKSRELEQEYFSLIESRFRIAEQFLGKVDFVHMTIVFTDYLQHFFWDSDFSLAVFRKIDRCIGELAAKAGPECFFALMSDHGFAEMRSRFFANAWLQQLGYQKTKEAVSNALLRAGLNKDSIVNFLKMFGLAKIAKSLVPRGLAVQLKSKHGLVSGPDKGALLDWKNSRVVCHSNDLFYIKGNGAEKDRIKRDLKQRLLGLRDPKTGEPIIKRVHERDEIYSGEFAGMAPDLVVEAQDWCEVNSALGSRELFEGESSWRAIHQGEGIFIVKGNGIKKGFRAGEKSLLDLAPTILRLMGLQAPGDMDGKIMGEIFEKGGAGQ